MLNTIKILLMGIGVVAFLLWWLVPHPTQEQIDRKVELIARRIRDVNFANFSEVEREAAYAVLQGIFQSSVWSLEFYVRVALLALVLTLIVLSIYFFIPFTDPLNVSLVGFWPFIWSAFMVPNLVISIVSMLVTVILLWISAYLRNAIFYLIACVLDLVFVVGLFTVISINLELTRNYLLDAYNGAISYRSYHVFSQLLVAVKHVASNPLAVSDVVTAEIYTQQKYTTYYPTITAMFVALVPTVVHLLIAASIVISRIFHDYLKRAVSYALFRIAELKSFFNFLMRACAATVIVIQIYQYFLSQS